MKITKAILTGGGRATRLRPVTTTINKHLLPIAGKPMIFHAIEKAVDVGITDIFINTNPGETDLQKYIGDGSKWGVHITFFEQTGGPQGIAHVVNEAYKFIGDDPFMFYLSDNILLGSLKDIFSEFGAENYDCMLALSKVPDPERFGVPVFNENHELIDVLEKPKTPPNDFAVTGVYLYGPKLFFEAFTHIQKSARGEYEISDIHSHFLKDGKKVGYKEITGWWKDTGKTEDLLLATKLLLEYMPASEFQQHGTVHPNAKITGNVAIGINTEIREGVSLIGPVMIGENCILEHCVVGPCVTIESGSSLYGSQIENSILLQNANIKAPLKIVDSLIGKDVKVVKRESDEIQGHRMIIGDNTFIEV